MNKIIFLLVLVGSLTVHAQNKLTIEDVIARARAQSPSSKRTETAKKTRYWEYRTFRARYNPQLAISGNAPSYSLSYVQVVQQDGSRLFQPINQTNSLVNVGLQQPLRWTGGTISANTNFNYFTDIARNSKLWSGNVFNIRLDQPIYAYNSFKWDRLTLPLKYEESKREFVEQLEFISQNASDLFFRVIAAQIDEQIARFNLANNDTIFKIEQGRYNIGTTSQDKLLQVELQLLKSKQDVAAARINKQNASLLLRIYLGLKNDEEFELLLPETVPLLEPNLDEALRYAKLNRAAYVSFERRRLEAESEVARAKGSRLATTLVASYGLNNAGLVVGDLYNNPQQQQQFNVGFNIPVLNWGRNKATMQTAYANKKLNDYTIAQDEVNAEQEIITQVRQFELLRLQIEITKKSDEVARERYNVAQNRYLIGKIDITNLNIALTEKDNAKRSYLEALRTYWSSYFNLRRLTLFDFATGTLLYTPDN
ncbi:MAG: TolC family protein [Cytophagales bacterium]|jgi:outer membrane protein TolC|nr:TolC family protein [Cytophagales bacterium]MCA6388392.1 TolC family protein [Cytophagales bacterium]MCA6391286.1 TolC family protein [Cytophagales bacterium]MCA6394474.1 TolC family protein [Cytophagales bacterium]MCA6397226.1 TolC family protein [Cytophagales bacterium]